METKRIQSVIKMAVVIVFVGYVFIWVILPTNLYKKDWLLKVRAKTMSTYFGTQGSYIFFYFLLLSPSINGYYPYYYYYYLYVYFNMFELTQVQQCSSTHFLCFSLLYLAVCIFIFCIKLEEITFKGTQNQH